MYKLFSKQSLTLRHTYLIIAIVLSKSLAVQIGEECIAEIPRWIVKTELLVDLTQLVQIFLFQLEIARQITPYPLGRLALRQHAVSVCDPPRQRHLRAVLAVLLADLNNGRVLDQLPHVPTGVVDFVLVAKGRVLLHVDAFLFVERGEGGLLEPGVAFDLVRGGDDGRFVEDALQLGFAEVGDADGFRLAAFEGFLHGFPCVDVVGVARFELSVLPGHEDVASSEGGGPVHEVEVQIVCV